MQLLPRNPPTCTLYPLGHTYTRFFASHALARSLPWTARDSKRGSKTQSDSRQRSDFSLGMSLGFGHKSHRIHIYQLGPSFCPGERRTGSGPFTRPAPPGVHCQGQPNVWPSGPLTDVPLPCHTHGSAHTHTHMHTHSTLPSTFSRIAPYNTPRPHQTKSPTAPFEKLWFRPQRWKIEGHRAVMHGRQTLPPVDMNRIHPANWIRPQYHV